MHTYGLYYIHKDNGLQIDSQKAADEEKAKKAFARQNKKCIKVTRVWNSDPGFNNDPKQRA